MTAAISARGLSKQYRLARDRAHSLKEAVVRRTRDRGFAEFWALRDVDLDVERGAFVGLIGHNGSGKSTLLKLLAGIHRPTAGDLVVDGRVSALLELGSGFHPELSGRENVYLNGAILGLTRREMDAAVDEIIDFSGIGDFIDAPVKVLSSGMYVRLGFAVSVHVEPEILLVDEVIAVGDEEFQRRCLDHMYELRRRGVTIVLVSHSIPLVEGLCDEVVWLDHGRVEQIGESSEVCNAYLKSVNVIEADRLSDEGTTAELPADQVAEIELRRGTGEVRAFHVDYLFLDHTPRPVATSGDPLLIRLWYEATEEVEDPVFGLRIHTAAGTHVGSPSSALHGVAMGVVGAGRGYVDFILDRLLLLPGEYIISTSITDNTRLRTYDAWERSYHLKVQPGSSLEREGIVEIGGRWQPAVPHQLGEPGHPDR